VIEETKLFGRSPEASLPRAMLFFKGTRETEPLFSINLDERAPPRAGLPLKELRT
jgi:hypothetical protein